MHTSSNIEKSIRPLMWLALRQSFCSFSRPIAFSPAHGVLTDSRAKSDEGFCFPPRTWLAKISAAGHNDAQTWMSHL